jgi:hypothetical protein
MKHQMALMLLINEAAVLLEYLQTVFYFCEDELYTFVGIYSSIVLFLLYGFIYYMLSH